VVVKFESLGITASLEAELSGDVQEELNVKLKV
jgi:hypothetical protein